MSMEGQVAIVTGGAQGIGFAIAAHLAEKGARVVIGDRRGAAESAAVLAGRGLEAIGVQVDVTDEQQVAEMVQAAESRFGRLDVLVNNAGIYSTLTPTPFEQLTAQDWRQVLDVNVIGLFLCCQAATGAFRRAGGGRIVNISSGVAFKGNPLMAHYVASKGAVISLTRALATELGPHNVLVNSVAPGFTLSDGVDATRRWWPGSRAPR